MNHQPHARTADDATLLIRFIVPHVIATLLREETLIPYALGLLEEDELVYITSDPSQSYSQTLETAIANAQRLADQCRVLALIHEAQTDEGRVVRIVIDPRSEPAAFEAFLPTSFTSSNDPRTVEHELSPIPHLFYDDST